MSNELACWSCGDPNNLWSEEPASVMYTVAFTRNTVTGEVEMDYTGVGHETLDEGAEYVGNIWCRSCGTQLTEDQLTEPETEES